MVSLRIWFENHLSANFSTNILKYISFILQSSCFDCFEFFFAPEIKILSRHFSFVDLQEKLPWPSSHRKFKAFYYKWSNYQRIPYEIALNNNPLSYERLKKIRPFEQNPLINTSFPDLAKLLYDYCYDERDEWELKHYINREFVVNSEFQ